MACDRPLMAIRARKLKRCYALARQWSRQPRVQRRPQPMICIDGVFISKPSISIGEPLAPLARKNNVAAASSSARAILFHLQKLNIGFDEESNRF